ncbi:MAG: hypothetical protein PXX77_11295 [Gallionella sp.]|nr:hypothetical protein [Gallionella sp.]
MNGDDIRFTLDQLLKRPVAFFPAFAKIGGSVNAGIMLSQLWYWSDGRAWNKEGWIWKTALEWAKETALSESEVEGARKKLVERGLIQYKRAGLPAKPHYLLNKQAILEAVISLQTDTTSLPNSGKQGESDSANKTDEKHDSGSPKSEEHNTETSPESSSETTPTTTTASGVVDDMNCKIQTPVWQEGELAGNLEELIAASYWMQHKTEGVRNPAGFKSAVRKRITAKGPNAEDWETLTAWRTSQTKPAIAENPEEIQRASEKKQRLANAKQRYGAMDEVQKREIKLRFAAHLQVFNGFAYKAYCTTELESGMVAGTFYEWLAGESE